MLYERLSQVFGGHVITNEWGGHTGTAAGSGTGSQARLFSSVRKGVGGSTEPLLRSLCILDCRELSQPLLGSLVTRSIYTDTDVNLAREFNVGFVVFFFTSLRELQAAEILSCWSRQCSRQCGICRRWSVGFGSGFCTLCSLLSSCQGSCIK